MAGVAVVAALLTPSAAAPAWAAPPRAPGADAGEVVLSVRQPVRDGHAVVDVAGPPGAAGIVGVERGAAGPVRLDAAGRGSLRLAVEDGTQVLKARFISEDGTPYAGDPVRFAVDTVTPRLQLGHDAGQAEDGTLRLLVRGEKGARLTVSGAGEREERTMDADDGEVVRALEPGTYQVRATLTDAAGNRSRKELAVRVPEPSGVPVAVVAAGGGVLLLGVVGVALGLRRRRGAAA